MTKTQQAGRAEEYVRFWNTPHGEQQREMAQRLFADDIAHRAVIGERDGRDGLLALSEGFTEHLGQVDFRARRAPQLVGQSARVQWEIIRGDAVFAEGTDVLGLDAEGRIATVVSFLDTPPEGFEPQHSD